MKERFEGPDGQRRLVAALTSQKIIAGNADVAAAIAKVATIIEMSQGKIIITENASDNEIFLILSGTVSVSVKGLEVAVRSATEHVGEMAAIDPSLPRSATCTAKTECVLATISEATISAIAEEHPFVWRNMAKELAQRLSERNKLVRPANDKPRIFIISSAEALRIAQEIQSGLHREYLVTVWSDGVFFASGYSLEALEEAVDQSDFAVAIAQPDDVVESRGKSSVVARDNVIFELGLFMGRLTRPRTLLLQPAGKELKLPSDLHGLTAISYRQGDEKDLPSLLAPACNDIRKLVIKHGVRH